VELLKNAQEILKQAQEQVAQFQDEIDRMRKAGQEMTLLPPRGFATCEAVSEADSLHRLMRTTRPASSNSVYLLGRLLCRFVSSRGLGMRLRLTVQL